MENADLDHRYGGPDYVRPATVYIALSTADPTEDGSGLAEPSGNAYARVAVTNNDTNFPAAAAGVKSNGTEIQFSTPTPAGWGVITHVAVFDAAAAGNMLDYAALDVAKTINAEDDVYFPAGTLEFTED